jgi:hypothetical protein
LSVDDASALENTLARIRQRYALHFLVPPDAKPSQERNIEVALADSARRRYPDAEIRYRHTYFTSDAPRPAVSSPDQSVVVVQMPAESRTTDSDSAPSSNGRRRRAVNEDGTPIGGAADSGVVNPNPNSTSTPQGGWPRTDNPTPATQAAPAPATQATPTADPPKKGGWPRVKPNQQP